MSLLPPISTRSAKFEMPGTTVTGKLLEIGDEEQATIYDGVRKEPTDKPAFWDEERTRPKMQRRFLVQCQPDPNIEGDDGRRAIYAIVMGKPGSLYKAIYDALAQATALGGILSVTYTGDDPNSQGTVPRKLYTATYQAPGLMGGQPQQQATQQQPAQGTPGGPAATDWPATQGGPQRPATITEAAWAQMDDATKAAVAASQAGQPPF